jgi:hypothetical protein
VNSYLLFFFTIAVGFPVNMSKNVKDMDEGEEALELEGSGAKERAKNSKRRQTQRRLKFSRGKYALYITE